MFRRAPLFSVFLASLLAAASAFAVDLAVWRSAEDAPRVIVPAREGESPSAAVRRYLESVHRNPELRALMPEGGLDAAIGRTELLGKAETSATRLAFVANWMDDMSPKGERIRRNVKTFSAAGADPYVIALAADIGLTEAEANEFRGKVARSFDLLVSLGGHDIAPEAYGEKTTFSRDTNLARDRAELALVKAFKEEKRGIFFGICRGHQMGAVADGHALHQDLSKTGAGSTPDHINSNARTSGEMQTWHHITVEKSSLLERFLRKFLDERGRVLVNSVHHQAVHPSAAAASAVTATHPTSGVESLQQKDGLGLSVQFHPEFPKEISGNAEFSKMGFHLIKSVVAYARLQRQRVSAAGSCSRVFD